jgi:diaminopimelate epimerase
VSFRFSKMHGIGNDFVVIDRRRDALALDPALVARIADRHTGVGFDQLLTLDPATRADCHAAYRIFNADGSEARQCGNGVRCLVAWLARAGELGADAVRLEGPAGPVDCALLPDRRVRVAMGVPRFEPADLPFLAPPGQASYTLSCDGESIAFRIAAIGNPHVVLEVDDVATAPLGRLGPWLERHPAFPDRVNVGFAAVRGRHAIDLRVHERGAGETLACGSGASAAAAALVRAGRVASPVAVRLPGGMLDIDWAGDGQPLSMTGPAAFVFDANWTQ